MGEIVAYCAAAARATVMSVSPVESETRCRWKKPFLRWIIRRPCCGFLGKRPRLLVARKADAGPAPQSVHIGACPAPPAGHCGALVDADQQNGCGLLQELRNRRASVCHGWIIPRSTAVIIQWDNGWIAPAKG